MLAVLVLAVLTVAPALAGTSVPRGGEPAVALGAHQNCPSEARGGPCEVRALPAHQLAAEAPSLVVLASPWPTAVPGRPGVVSAPDPGPPRPFTEH